MKARYTTFSAALLAASATQAFAQANLPAPPPMDAYMAYQAPKAPVQERVQNAAWFLRGWYLTGQAGYSWVSVNNISNTTATSDNFGTTPNPVKTSTSATKFMPGIAIGYQFRNSGIFSRVELAGQSRTNISYNANPFIPAVNGVTSSINSDIRSYTLLAKFYDDFDFGSPIVPYIQLGVGAAFNKTSANSNINISVISVPPINLVFNGSGDETTTNLAADAGLGARYRLSPNFLFDLGYEFDYLGPANWNINYTLTSNPNPQTTINLKSKYLYSNTIYAGLTWMPMPKDFTNNSN